MSSDIFFTMFQSLLAEVNTTFDKMRQDYPQEVKCTIGCTDCCHASFDISLVEAGFLKAHFRDKIQDAGVRKIIEDQSRAARDELTRQLAELPEGISSVEKEEHVAKWRIRCPLLSPDDTCYMYEYRPITCRLYGVPLAIRGKGHVCGFSGFDAGKTYPTVKLDTIFTQLDKISHLYAEHFPDLESSMAGERFFIHDLFFGSDDDDDETA